MGLEEEVVRVFAARGLRLAVAESLTGGLLGARLTRVPGASRAFAGGLVTYTDDAKRRLLGIEVDGDAVSERVAGAMARGCRERLGADVGVALTGIAGPDAPAGLPTGLVVLAVATARGEAVAVHTFPGDRDAVREASVDEALRMALAAASELRE